MFAIDKNKSLSLAVGCAVLGGIAGWMFLCHLEKTYQESGETLTVLTVRHYIPPGTPLRPALFQRVAVPKAYAQPGAVSEFNILDSSGRPRFRSSLQLPEGTQLLQRELQPLTQGEALSQLLGENQTAVSFGVDSVRGLGGNLLPGDLIDILHTPKGPEMAATSTGLLFQAVPVIAVGKKWATPSRLNTGKESPPEDPLEKGEEDITVLTVLLNPVASIRLAQFRENETLSIILRAPGDTAP